MATAAPSGEAPPRLEDITPFSVTTFFRKAFTWPESPFLLRYRIFTTNLHGSTTPRAHLSTLLEHQYVKALRALITSQVEKAVCTTLMRLYDLLSAEHKGPIISRIRWTLSSKSPGFTLTPIASPLSSSSPLGPVPSRTTSSWHSSSTTSTCPVSTSRTQRRRTSHIALAPPCFTHTRPNFPFCKPRWTPTRISLCSPFSRTCSGPPSSAPRQPSCAPVRLPPSSFPPFPTGPSGGACSPQQVTSAPHITPSKPKSSQRFTPSLPIFAPRVPGGAPPAPSRLAT
mmetsp:Transcript_32098/g.74672  ORF Transcript_32098/g.74672 Transcript_32098/m.74672 type:complete len:284 (+) Transcript_32098:98-949(+)